jgi:hypothetical protein
MKKHIMRSAILDVLLVFTSIGFVIAAALAFEVHRDVGPFNRFADAYNDYVAIDPRIQDLKALKRMLDAWRALGRSQHWSEEKPCGEQ